MRLSHFLFYVHCPLLSAPVTESLFVSGSLACSPYFLDPASTLSAVCMYLVFSFE